MVYFHLRVVEIYQHVDLLASKKQIVNGFGLLAKQSMIFEHSRKLVYTTAFGDCMQHSIGGTDRRLHESVLDPSRVGSMSAPLTARLINVGHAANR